MIVERADRDAEAAFGALAAQLVGDALRGAQVRPEQHQQRRPVRRRGRARRGVRFTVRLHRDGRGGRLVLRSSPRSGPVGAGTDLDPEVVGLDGERRLGVELVVPMIDELEPLQQHAEDERRLLQGELAPDARPQAGAERPVRRRRHRLDPLRREMVGVELLGILAPHARSRCSIGHQHRQPEALREGVFRRDDGVLQRAFA